MPAGTSEAIDLLEDSDGLESLLPWPSPPARPWATPAAASEPPATARPIRRWGRPLGGGVAASCADTECAPSSRVEHRFSNTAETKMSLSGTLRSAAGGSSSSSMRDMTWGDGWIMLQGDDALVENTRLNTELEESHRVADERTTGVLFEDPDFPAETRSITGRADCVWGCLGGILRSIWGGC